MIAAKQLLQFIDYTSLSDSDTNESIAALCQQAAATSPQVAAVCVYPQFVKLAKQLLSGSAIKIASVANFPSGTAEIDQVEAEIAALLADGADEVDVVWPYQRFLAGDLAFCQEFLVACRAAAKNTSLKVIIESGAIQDPEKIYQAAVLVIRSGAEFVKTSTGKIEAGASIEAATAIMQAIVDCQAGGLKVSGGVRRVEDALAYYKLLLEQQPHSWISQDHFRIGASQLVAQLVKQ